jgi:hypothetical protein
MKPWDEDCLHLALDDSERFNPLLTEGGAPITDEDAAWIEALCEAATRGPLLIDDQASGEGAVVATLPDGRHIISLAPDASSTDPAVIEANARLIRQARCLLLRLLGDRNRWCREREELLARLTAMEAAASSSSRPEEPRVPRGGRRISSIPR